MKKFHFSRHISNYISTVLVYFLRMLIPVIIVILIGRLYSTEEFGRYAVALSFMGVLGLFLTFGVSHVAGYEIASIKPNPLKQPDRIKEILKACITILLFFSGTGLLLMLGGLAVLNYSMALNKIIIAMFFGYFFMAFNSVLSAVFVGIKDMRWIIPSILTTLVSVVVIVLPFILLKKPLPLIAALWSASQFTGIIVSGYLLKRMNLWFSLKSKSREFFRLTKRSIGVGLDNVIYKFGVNLTNIILPLFLTEVQIGIFNGAFKPFVLFIAGNQITFQFFNPYIASRMHEKKKEKEKVLNIFHKINVIFTCSVIILPIFFSGLLNRIIFGNKLLDSIPYMFLLGFGYFIYYMPPYSNALKALGKEWKVVYSSVGQLIINLIGIVILVPKYGVKGAVYAVMLAFLGYWMINAFLYVREKIRPVTNVTYFIIFIMLSFINGFLINRFFNQKFYSILLFLLINSILAYFVFLTRKEKREIFSYIYLRRA